MRGSGVQSTLRASLFYVGSALFMATGAVTIADQPFPPGPYFYCAGCIGGDGGDEDTYYCGGYSCWDFRTNCTQVNCGGVPLSCPCS